MGYSSISTGAVDNTITSKNVVGLTAWSFDVMTVSGTFTPIVATIYLAKIPIPFGITLTNLAVITTTAGIDGATPMSNAQVGVYASTGTLIASATAAATKTALQATAGYQSIVLAAESGQSLVVAGGPTTFVWAAIHVGVQGNGTAVIIRASGGSTINSNLGLTAATSRYGTYTGHATNNLTTIGALTPSSITAAPSAMWMGLV